MPFEYSLKIALSRLAFVLAFAPLSINGINSSKSLLVRFSQFNYRLMPEGTLTNYDGLTINVNKDAEGLDLNRNFPAFWRQEFEQAGAGAYPASEPEVKAMVDFVVGHPNVGAAISYHTHSGVILRPMGTMSDDDMIRKTCGRSSASARSAPS